jgi:selenocysteine lyase/cysteine desulfurase
LDLDKAARRYENGTLKFMGITSLHRSLSTLLEIGVESIEEHVLALSAMLIAELESLGVAAYVAGERKQRAVIISIRVPDADELLSKLAQSRIEVGVRQGVVRVTR